MLKLFKETYRTEEEEKEEEEEEEEEKSASVATKGAAVTVRKGIKFAGITKRLLQQAEKVSLLGRYKERYNK